MKIASKYVVARKDLVEVKCKIKGPIDGLALRKGLGEISANFAWNGPSLLA